MRRDESECPSGRRRDRGTLVIDYMAEKDKKVCAVSIITEDV
jgi:hypothetical protein